MGSFYSHQKSGVVGDYETKWILINSLSCEKSIDSYQAINKVRNDND